ncbi:MAG: HlyC/CorC family transporter [bacterium]|nr:HlyC/CorC family transporter [bacterium]
MSEPTVPLYLSGWCFTLALPLTVLASVLSALLGRSGLIRLRHWAEEAGGGLRRLGDEPAAFEAFRLLVSLTAKLMPLILAGSLWAILAAWRVADAWWIAPLTVAVLLLLIEWLNSSLVELHSEDSLRTLTMVLRPIYAVSRPAVWLLSRFIPVTDTSEEEEDEDEASEEEIDAFIDVGLREGILEPEEEELVRSIVDFGDTQVRSVMTPRVEMRSVSADASLEELAKAFFDWKHARLPVYSKSIDQIVGILHIRDLFEAIHGGLDKDATALSNPPHYVPESKPLRELLEEMQKRQQQMAIVVDEYGGVAGLVTVEDLVEEIVGEIADEHERPRRHRVKLDDHRWRVRGRIPLEDLGELFDLDFDDLPYETVSGLICGELGYVPKAGEVVDTHGLTFAIEEADERRVMTVAVGREVIEEARKA